VRVCATSAALTAPLDLTASLTAGLTYPQVSAYIDVPEGTYDVKVVDAAGDCSGAAIVSSTGVMVPNGSLYTVLVTGNNASTDEATKPAIRMYTDETAAAAASHVRLIHAAAGAPVVDVGAYVGTSFAKVFPGVSYGDNQGLATTNTDPTTPVDAQGYAAIPLPVDTTTIFEVRLASTGQVYAALTSPVALPVGSLVTAFAYGLVGADQNGNPTGINVLACLDGMETGGLTTCAPFVAAAGTVPRPSLRVAHVSPEATVANLDICVKPASYGKWLPDASQALIQGLAYKSITSELAATRLPADTYDLKVLAHASPTDCSKDATDPSFASGKLPIDGTTRATLAATGILGGGVNQFAFKIYPNTDTTTETANASVRFIHATAGIAAVDVGPVKGAFLWSDIAYGAAGDYKPTLFSGGDRIGVNYQSTADYDLATAALTAAQSTVKGNVYTAWAIGDVTAGSTNKAPPAILLCEETPAPAGPTLACNELPLLAP
jgi:hypothetical protein